MLKVRWLCRVDSCPILVVAKGWTPKEGVNLSPDLIIGKHMSSGLQVKLCKHHTATCPLHDPADLSRSMEGIPAQVSECHQRLECHQAAVISSSVSLQSWQMSAAAPLLALYDFVCTKW